MADLPAQVSFEEFIQSDLFTFYIGEEKKAFIVHSKAVAATSQYFDRLVNGGMNEAQSRSAELQDVDPDTFVRFLEYVYRQDFTTPSWTEDPEGIRTGNNGAPGNVPDTYTEQPPEPPPPETPVPEVAVIAEFDDWAFERPTQKKKKTKKQETVEKKVTLRSSFEELEYLREESRPSNLLAMAYWLVLSNTGYRDNFTPVFLGYARLYTLADMRLVHPLKKLVLFRLHQTLKCFTLYEERIGDILELARYAYRQGADRSEDGRLDELRELVVRYVASEAKTMGKHKEFRRVMDEGGEFAGDLWDLISPHMT